MKLSNKLVQPAKSCTAKVHYGDVIIIYTNAAHTQGWIGVVAQIGMGEFCLLSAGCLEPSSTGENYCDFNRLMDTRFSSETTVDEVVSAFYHNNTPGYGFEYIPTDRVRLTLERV